MCDVRLTVELGTVDGLVGPVLDVILQDVADAVQASDQPVEWTWNVDGAVVRMTAQRPPPDTPKRHPLTAVR